MWTLLCDILGKFTTGLVIDMINQYVSKTNVGDNFHKTYRDFVSISLSSRIYSLSYKTYKFSFKFLSFFFSFLYIFKNFKY